MHSQSIALSPFLSQWSLDPGPLVAASIALALFGQGFLRLRRRGRCDHASWDRPVLFTLGLAFTVVPLVSPIDPLGDEYLLSAHMLEHVLLGDAGPALMVCAVRGPLFMFLLPPVVLRALAPTQWVRSSCSILIRPRVSLAIWAVVMGCWHIPAAYDYTLTHQTVHDAEHASFAMAGVLVWTQLIDPARQSRLRLPQRLLFAFALFVLGQVLADVLILTLRPLYPSYAHQPDRILGISPLLDQRLAGLVMMVEQAITLGTFSAVAYTRSRRVAANARLEAA